MAIGRDQYLESMAHAAAAVSVVATDGTHGRFGQTVTAMCSVSAEPPTLLVCVNRRSPLADAAARNGCLSVTIVTNEQRGLAECFAGRAGATPPYTFDDGWSSLRTGAPLRLDACAAFDCVLVKAVRAGSHAVLFGQVVAARHQQAQALTYGGRRYGTHWCEPD